MCKIQQAVEQHFPACTVELIVPVSPAFEPSRDLPRRYSRLAERSLATVQHASFDVHSFYSPLFRQGSSTSSKVTNWRLPFWGVVECGNQWRQHNLLKQSIVDKRSPQPSWVLLGAEAKVKKTTIQQMWTDDLDKLEAAIRSLAFSGRMRTLKSILQDREDGSCRDCCLLFGVIRRKSNTSVSPNEINQKCPGDIYGKEEQEVARASGQKKRKAKGGDDMDAVVSFLQVCAINSLTGDTVCLHMFAGVLAWWHQRTWSVQRVCCLRSWKEARKEKAQSSLETLNRIRHTSLQMCAPKGRGHAGRGRKKGREKSLLALSLSWWLLVTLGLLYIVLRCVRLYTCLEAQLFLVELFQEKMKRKKKRKKTKKPRSISRDSHVPSQHLYDALSCSFSAGIQTRSEWSNGDLFEMVWLTGFAFDDGVIWHHNVAIQRDCEKCGSWSFSSVFLLHWIGFVSVFFRAKDQLFGDVGRWTSALLKAPGGLGGGKKRRRCLRQQKARDIRRW